MNPKARKTINIIVDVLVIAVLVVSAVVLVFALSSRASGGVPNLFGKSPVAVMTDSMKGDKPDSFSKGDMLICDYTGGSNSGLSEGDIITFQQDITGNGEKSLVTHRIYKVNEDGSFLTKGDANDTYDQDPHNSIVFPNIYGYDVLAVYHGSKIPGIGNFFNLLQTPAGFFWCILLPMILFFLYQAVRVIMNAMAYSKEKGAEQARHEVENADLTEEQKARAIAEYLERQNGAKRSGEESDEASE